MSDSFDHLFGPPLGECGRCYRKTWAPSEVGQEDRMTQPDGSRAAERSTRLAGPVVPQRRPNMAEIEPRESLTVGSRVWFAEDVRPYTVKGISSDRRWVVCTKPFAARHTVLYTVIDFDNQVRGVDNLVFSIGYETDENCAASLALFEDGIAEHSRRHPPIPLVIRKVEVRFAADGGVS